MRAHIVLHATLPATATIVSCFVVTHLLFLETVECVCNYLDLANMPVEHNTQVCIDIAGCRRPISVSIFELEYRDCAALVVKIVFMGDPHGPIAVIGMMMALGGGVWYALARNNIAARQREAKEAADRAIKAKELAKAGQLEADENEVQLLPSL